MNYCEIGQKIRKYRKAKGLSQEQLAEMVGISVTHMSHIETGNTKLSLPVLVDLALALEVQSDDILFDKRSDKTITESELAALVAACTADQMKIILAVMRTIKTELDKYS